MKHHLQYAVQGTTTDIYVGEYIFSHLKSLTDPHVFIDENVWRHHEKLLYPFIHKWNHHVVTVSEKHKSLATIETMAKVLLEQGATRSSTIVAIGGGILGDLAGFLASTYMRGIKLVHIPTTLLSMVDSSLGGKNGVNMLGKNILGTIYQPTMVLVDPIFLTSLSEREVRSGMAEVIKYGCIKDTHILETLKASSHIDEDILTRCIKAKMEVVQHDPSEKNLRAILNFGHTIGHALEIATKYSLTHGEAIAIGMVYEAKLAAHKGILSHKEADDIMLLIAQCGLPVHLPEGLGTKKLLELMGKDKKRSGVGIPFVFPSALGKMRHVRGKFVHMISEHTVSSIL